MDKFGLKFRSDSVGVRRFRDAASEPYGLSGLENGRWSLQWPIEPCTRSFIVP